MSRTSRYGYILAKAYGALAKSFIGRNYQDVLHLRKLTDVYDLLYPGERHEATEHQMTAELEARIVKAGIESMTSILDMLPDHPAILVHMLRKFEYQALKSVLRGIVHGETSDVQVWDLGAYAGIQLVGAKDYEQAIAHSEYAWTLDDLSSSSIVHVENLIDRDYYTKLISLARELPPRDRTGVIKLVNLETSLANVVWALRLRFFFGMDAEKAEELLMPGPIDVQRKAVLQVFEIPADSIDGWRNWKFGWLLTEQLGEYFKAPDPVRAEQKATHRLYQRAHLLFHSDPFTLTPIVAFFKLKEYESDLLKTAVEALRLSVSEQDVLTLVGAQ